MERHFLKITFLIVALAAGFASLSAADTPTLNIQLKPDFDKELKCVWKSKNPATFWVGEIQDLREIKQVGVMINKEQETPVYSSAPLAETLKKALGRGLLQCGFAETPNKETADFWLTGSLQEFSGSSKKGFFKGKAEGKAELTVNLKHAVEAGQELSVSLAVSGEQSKGISKNPKKFETFLNNLLTQLTLEVFNSKQISEWIASR